MPIKKHMLPNAMRFARTIFLGEAGGMKGLHCWCLGRSVCSQSDHRGAAVLAALRLTFLIAISPEDPTAAAVSRGVRSRFGQPCFAQAFEEPLAMIDIPIAVWRVSAPSGVTHRERPDFARARLDLASVLVAQGDVPGAVQQLREASKSRNAEVAQLAAAALQRLGQR